MDNSEQKPFWLDRIPFAGLATMAVVLAILPGLPMPHLLEKLDMLFSGELVRGIDVFDLFWHGTLPALLIWRLIRMVTSKRRADSAS